MLDDLRPYRLNDPQAKMSLIHDCNEFKSALTRLQVKADEQQMLYHKVITGVVKLHQKHRVAKNYAVSDELRDLLLSVSIRIKQGTDGYKYEEIPEALREMTVDDQWFFDETLKRKKPTK